MTKVIFFKQKGSFSGFSVDGHSTVSAADDEGKLVCAAVSSAAYMAANTITEVVGAKADIALCDAKMVLKVTTKQDECQTVLKGFYIHIEQLSQQYPDNLAIITEV
ncbi:MAG: ribosomal-processing cysteine protease Prp [Clostridia bacterium]|nr:ribosomal-processing cysteine protease Prp [Clostridia bacterium]